MMVEQKPLSPGDKFNYLTVIRKATSKDIEEFQKGDRPGHGGTLYLCQCSRDGNYILCYGHKLVHGKAKSCGCLRNNADRAAERLKLLIGKSKDNLTVLDVVAPDDPRHTSKAGDWQLLVSCSCGRTEPFLTLVSYFKKGKNIGCRLCANDKISKERQEHIKNRDAAIGEIKLLTILRTLRHKITKYNLEVDKQFLDDLYPTDLEQFKEKILEKFPSFEIDYYRRRGLTFEDGRIASWDTLTYIKRVYLYNNKYFTVSELAEIANLDGDIICNRIYKYGAQHMPLILYPGKITKRIVDNYWMSLGRNVDVTDPIGKIVMKGDLGSDTELHMNELEEASPKRDKPTLLQRQFKQVFSK